MFRQRFTTNSSALALVHLKLVLQTDARLKGISLCHKRKSIRLVNLVAKTLKRGASPVEDLGYSVGMF